MHPSDVCGFDSDPRSPTYRPGESEADSDGVGEGALRDDVGDLERVGAEHGSHRAAVRARRLRGRIGLVVLQADPEEGFTFTLLLLVGRGLAARTAVLVPLDALLVEELLQLELEHSRTEALTTHRMRCI